MYDKLIKELRGKHRAYVLTGNEKPGKIFAEAADAIEELLQKTQQLPRWIPVAERLPDDRVEVLVSSGMFAPYIEVAFYDGLFYSAWDGETEIVAVTHWMPLPEPPTAEEGE